ncbi:MAG: transposase [Pseudonocardiaceae bacterium]|nr:transposase [Pseudonocardiaceae bacterium]
MGSSSSNRYPSDVTDEQWELIAPMVAVRRGGRPPVHARRRIVDAILYGNRTGCSWRQLPHDFPPWDTVYWYFTKWNADGTTDRIHDVLRAACRDAEARDPMASAGIVDAQSVKGADTVGARTRGYDAGLDLVELCFGLVHASTLPQGPDNGSRWQGPGPMRLAKARCQS